MIKAHVFIKFESQIKAWYPRALHADARSCETASVTVIIAYHFYAFDFLAKK